MREKRALLIVAVRTDHPPEIQRRIETILAATATYAEPPETTAAVWAKSIDELTANDLDRLAGFIGWDRVRDLNVGDVVVER
jgi:hypothetical protein